MLADTHMTLSEAAHSHMLSADYSSQPYLRLHLTHHSFDAGFDDAFVSIKYIMAIIICSTVGPRGLRRGQRPMPVMLCESIV